jgi:hypothetical protein
MPRRTPNLPRRGYRVILRNPNRGPTKHSLQPRHNMDRLRHLDQPINLHSRVHAAYTINPHVLPRTRDHQAAEDDRRHNSAFVRLVHATVYEAAGYVGWEDERSQDQADGANLWTRRRNGNGWGGKGRYRC